MRNIQIKTSRDNHVHAYNGRNSVTLCVLETSGDEMMGIRPGVVVDKKVNCPDCLEIIRFCVGHEQSGVCKLKDENAVLKKNVRVLDKEAEIYATALSECYEFDSTYPIAKKAMDAAEKMKKRSGLYK